MIKPQRASFRQRLGEADPVISMGQRLWDLITLAWGPITVSGLWGGLVTAAVYFSNWWTWIGPPGAVLLSFSVFLFSLFILSLLGYLRSIAAAKHFEIRELRNWQISPHQVNPLDKEFHTKRIKFSDLANPLTKKILNKRFIDCELMGPANVIFIGTSENAFSMTGVHLNNCDIVVIKENVEIFNVIILEDATILNGALFNCTLYIFPQMVPQFAAMNAPFLTLTGDPKFDSPFPKNVSKIK